MKKAKYRTINTRVKSIKKKKRADEQSNWKLIKQEFHAMAIDSSRNKAMRQRKSPISGLKQYDFKTAVRVVALKIGIV